MHSRRRPGFGFAIGLTALCLLGDGRFPENPTSPPTRRQSTLDRMRLERLEAVHADVQRLAKHRRDIPPLPGLLDLRTSCHAHAEDSAHTGGTRPEMLEGAHRAGVKVILLSDHFRPPRDFMDSWRGLKDGVLFIPGSEARGFLVHPRDSVMSAMNLPAPRLLAAVRTNGGLAFLSHIEERPDHPMDALDGLEIYNRHWDAKRDRATLLALALKLTDPEAVAQLSEGLRRFPAEMLASQIDYPADYLEKWDLETPKRRLTGVAANDAHHNQVFVVKKVDDDTVILGTIVDPDDKMQRVSALVRPSIRRLTKDRAPGEVLVRLDFDPYDVSFRTVSTHLLAPELTESAVREALREGHAYVSFDWMGDPTGFRFALYRDADSSEAVPLAISGDEVRHAETALRLSARFPLPCSRIRLIRNGSQVAFGRGHALDYRVDQPGVYRLEGWLRLDGEDRCWILSNPIYVR